MSGSATLGQVIRQRRMELGFTQEELAERIGDGVRQAEVSRLERDRVTLPRRARLEEIARALKLPVGMLLARSGWVGADRELERIDNPPLAAEPPPFEPEPKAARGALSSRRLIPPIPASRRADSVELHQAISRAEALIEENRAIMQKVQRSVDRRSSRSNKA